MAATWADEGADAAGASGPLSAAEIEARLDVVLDVVLSSRRTAAAPARALATFDRPLQEFVLRWVGIAARTQGELAYQMVNHAPEALRLLGREGTEAWLLQAMDRFDTSGLHDAMEVLGGVEAFAAELRARDTAAAFEQVGGALELFIRGLHGRGLRLEAGDRCFGDSETLHLPASLRRAPDRAGNRLLYKALAVQMWAQGWYGTFRDDPLAWLETQPDPARTLRLWATLERLRLDARIARELPGLWRELTALYRRMELPLVPEGFEEAAAALAGEETTAADSRRWAERLADRPLPEPAPHQPELDPRRVAEVSARRHERERQRLGVMVARMAEEAGAMPRSGGEEEGEAPRVEITPPEQPEGEFRITVDGRPITPPEGTNSLLSSILQDFGEIPPDWLSAAGPGGYKEDPTAEAKRERDPWSGTYHEEGALLYDEWDCKRQHYRKRWCVLREMDVVPGDPAFVAATLEKHAGLVHHIRRTFEILRGEEKTLKRQPDGDDIDMEALVEAYGDQAVGLEASDRLFTRRLKVERNIAVLFMVDMSGSTRGWINEAERESLVLLCEALEQLGDRYAIYGFSGTTRKRCELYRVKRFDEPYDETVARRIAGIEPRDYTRMGVIIRHLKGVLEQVEARTRVLITLSDGKPDDFDGYRGEYGIEDTRQALFEARRAGIHPFCITIDSDARDYLPHMYGAANWTLVDEVRKLPAKVADIYRRLTT
ncbi:MAG TPA: hypothetical protein ENK54_10190 [Thiotrichales bacterium]|nr:hypothetical protein [Thiotrichales bacterium]